jgi:Tfp pilus assembly protein PilV
MKLDFPEMSHPTKSRSAAHRTQPPLQGSRRHEAGFTLVEAMIATLVLMFGLTAIFNLMIVATSQNALGSRATAATALAGKQMEVLRSTAFTALTDSPSGVDTVEIGTSGFEEWTTVTGVGTFHTTWKVQTLSSPNFKSIVVRSEPNGFRGRWARAEFTTVRTCTTGTASGCL